MSKPIYLVYSCNAWKERPMPLLMVTASRRKVKMFISNMILSEEAEYDFGHGIEFSAKKQAEEFRKAFDNEEIFELNNRLWYVFINCVADGEEL